MRVSATVWGVTLALILGILAIDLLVVSRRRSRPTMRQAGFAVCIYVTLALLFGVWVDARWGGSFGGQFYAGWLTEYSLSFDNLFIFMIIMARFKVPAANQQTVLLVGIVLALVLRGLFIAAGAVLIARFSWVFYVFGGFLVWTAIGLVRRRDGDDEIAESDRRAESAESAESKDNLLMRATTRVLPTSRDYDGQRIRTVVDGRRVFTPMLAVMVAIGSTDVLFALDSIPAIFGLTKQPYLVFTANAFALMGLMQLFFLLGGLLERLVFLGRGLAVVLGFIGSKLILDALHANSLPFVNGGTPVEWAPEIPISASLAVIAGVLVVTGVASLTFTRRTGA